MIPTLLGTDAKTGKKKYLDLELFQTHFHLVGATGTGKSTALQTILQPLMLQPGPDKCCLFLIDPIGNLSRDLLRFIAHPTFCTDYVRDRLVYIEPANEDFLMPFNPLTYTSEANRYYQTMRAVDIVLRAWAAQDLAQQPRLLQWTYKAFCAAAMLGLPIAMCRYLLHPGTDEHTAILNRIPGDVRFQWHDILRARGGNEAVRILESTRNRLDPFFNSPILLRMFGSRRSLFDCERMIRERKIVLLNLGKYGKIPGFVADTIGALALNEIVETASRLSTDEGREVVEPTYVVMDEFQRFVSVDIEEALPTVRQMGLRLMLAHQSFAQLERADIDLTDMIWQARSRLIFANSARDADILADELAKLTFDNKTIKDLRTSLKQLIVGYRREWLRTESTNRTRSEAEMVQFTTGYSQGRGQSIPPGLGNHPTLTTQEGEQRSTGHGRTKTDGTGDSHGQHEVNVPIHHTFEEVTKVTYEPFDEFALGWGQGIRKLRRGEAFAKFAEDDQVYHVRVQHDPIPDTSGIRERVQALLEHNYASEYFITAEAADREAEVCRLELLRSATILITSGQQQSEQALSDPLDSGPLR